MRGFLLSLDALMAISILLLLSVFLSGLGFTYRTPELKYQRLYYAGKDLLTVTQELRIADIQDYPSIQHYMQEGVISSADLDKSFLDVVGSLWAAGNVDDARNMTGDVMGSILNGSKYGFEIIMGNTSIYLRNNTGQDHVARLSTIISGYDVGRPVSGHVANAFLSRFSKITSSFEYFGGYVGDGNMTRIIELPSDAVVTDVEIEANTGGPFDLFVNGNPLGSYTPLAVNLSADTWSVCSSVPSCSDFTGGNNTLNINFTNRSRHIGGGFIRVTYNTSEPNTIPIAFDNQTATKFERFPGIEGIINLYSSFYVPGRLSSITAYLHYMSNYTIFMSIGNVSVFEGNSTGEVEVNLDNESVVGNLSAGGLGMDSLSNVTVPVRIGIVNISHIVKYWAGKDVDVVLITDLSDSMEWRLDSEAVGVERECNDSNLYSPDTKRISLAKCLDKEFIDIILNISGNRVGLSGFYGDDTPPYKARVVDHNITTDGASLKGHVESYNTSGGTCICCAINDAYNILNAQSNESRKKFIVVMSDGIPTHACGASGDCEGERTEGLWLGWGAGCYGGMEDCVGTDCQCAMQNANWSSCRAHNDLNITVHSIGFGPVSDCQNANWTLQNVADCGGGSYYTSDDADELQAIYRGIAKDILNASYVAQTVEVYGNISMDTVLYPDSYLRLEYEPHQKLDYGEISVTMETDRFGGNETSPKNGSFYIPGDVKVLDAKVTSYSSNYWTDRLLLSNTLTGGWKKVFDLSVYGSDYEVLGDPYAVYIPVNLVGVGENNLVSVDTALGPDNTTGGSPDDRVIYSLGVEGAVGYGDVFFTSEEARDDAIQRLENKLAAFGITPTESRVDSQSVSGVTSMWGPSKIEVRCWI